MNDNELYRYVTSQLGSGVPKSEIIDKLVHFDRVSREEAENYVDSIDVSAQDIGNIDNNKPKSAVREFIELALSAIILAVAFGNFFYRGIESASSPFRFSDFFFISLLAVSLGFIFHELGHRFVARKYGYTATYSLWIPGLLLAIITSFFSIIFAAPGAVWIRSKEKTDVEEKEYLKHLGKISITGPLVNVVLAIIFLLLSYFVIFANRFVVFTPILSVILIVGAHINGILAAFNLIPVGPFDGRKVFKWNKVIWSSTAIIAVGLFLFIQSPLSSLDDINAPKEPTSYNLYTDLDGRFSFNYPANWMQITSNSGSEWGAFFRNHTDYVSFRDRSDSGIIGILVMDWYKDRPDVVIDEAILLELADNLIEDLDWKLISKNKITIDPLADEGQREAYEVILQSTSEDEVTFIIAFTHADNYIYMLIFGCISEYYNTLLPAYDQLIASVRFR